MEPRLNLALRRCCRHARCRVAVLRHCRGNDHSGEMCRRVLKLNKWREFSSFMISLNGDYTYWIISIRLRNHSVFIKVYSYSYFVRHFTISYKPHRDELLQFMSYLIAYISAITHQKGSIPSTLFEMQHPLFCMYCLLLIHDPLKQGSPDLVAYNI